MNIKTAVAPLTLTLIAALAPAARAIEDSHCSSGEVGSVRTYLSIDRAAPGDTRATNGRVRLRGWVYIPSGTPPAGGFPVIVFNHGSGQETESRCTLADFFVAKRRYMLFVPARRGHDGSTGEYFEDYAERKTNATCNGGCPPDLRTFWTKYWTVEYLRDQRDDVTSAILYIKTYPKANPHKIAVMGHSFGGIVSVFWNVLTGEDTKAVIDIAGGSQSWVGTPYLQQEMKEAVAQAKRPFFFLQPKNDVSIQPTIELTYVAGKNDQRYQSAIFAPVPQSLIQPCPRPDPNAPGETLSCGDVAHGKFAREASEIAKWGPTVADFLRRMGVR